MSFTDFLNTFIGGSNLFFNSMVTIANYLITNYIFLVFLGVTITISLIKYCYGFIFNPVGNLLYDLDNPNEKNKRRWVKNIDDKIESHKYERYLRRKYPQLYRRKK